MHSVYNCRDPKNSSLNSSPVAATEQSRRLLSIAAQKSWGSKGDREMLLERTAGIGEPLEQFYAIAILVALVIYVAVSDWPALTTLRHLAASPNCDAARLVNLAPARRGAPGYWASHDADGEGIACEPWPRSTRF